jgi:hypothetical protein
VPTQQPKYVTTADGRQITYARWRYEEQVKQEAVLKQVNDLITNQASAVVSAGASLGLQEYGGLLREVIPTLLDQYGNINAQAAIDYYNSLSMEQIRVNGSETRTANRLAARRTQSALAVAQGYTATFADTYDVVAKTDAVVNFAMKVRATQGHAPSVDAMNNALTREVAMYHRDTVLFNAALDPYVSRVQRVAQASACEFCRLMAIGSDNGKVRVSTYAVKFHDHCHCTIQPLFQGEAPVRPDYYDSFEAQYNDASASGGNAKDILSNMRKTTK